MRYVALLRAVNVGGTSLPMAALRELCVGLGWRDVRTYVQSGNVVFDADDADADMLEGVLEKAVEQRFGFRRPAMVRTAAQWAAFLTDCPFREEAQSDPKRLHLCIAKLAVPAGAAALIEVKARDGEAARVSGGVLWIHFGGGVGTSRLTPALLDKAAGSPVTARNFRTVVAIRDLLCG